MNGQLELEVSNDYVSARAGTSQADTCTAHRGGKSASGVADQALPTINQPERTAPISPHRLKGLLILSDAGAIIVGMTLATVIMTLMGTIPNSIMLEHMQIAIVAAPFWLAAMGLNRLFTARVINRRAEEFRRILWANVLGVAFVIAFGFLIQFTQLSRLWVALLFACVTGTLSITRTVARRVFAGLRERGACRRRVVIVGTGVDALSVLDTTRRHPHLGYEVVGLTSDDDIGELDGMRITGRTADTLEVIERSGAMGAILSVSSLAPSVVNTLTRQLTKAGYHVTLSPALCDIDVSRALTQEIDGRMLIYVEPTGTSKLSHLGKRFFDVVLAVMILVLTAPVIAIAAVAIRLDSDGPVFFTQRRVGRNGELFQIAKLRTMTADAEQKRQQVIARNGADSRLFKMHDDPRVTRVGKFHRKTSIDELPQLWNVLRGDMSIVGPRPALPEEMAQWDSETIERLQVLPGITGMWQVSGRSDTDFEQYRRLDLYYVDNWSLLSDLSIMARTFSVVVFGKGAS
jgi:exopolysaccharide biosynthesis polyprenyl glycosylphosphotransferase